ncbi:MAG TPA: Ku protein [Actinopolymorphaceae bacterium]|jgi:DNA end-binding protein Ku
MQSIWKGAVSFGLVTIPVKVFAATEEKDISFRQVHAADGGRIRYKRVCDIDGEEVPYSDIAKGYEMPDGEILVLEADDLADLPLTSRKVIDVLEFVPMEQIDSISLARAYYLGADGGPAEKPYVLLRDALAESDRVAIVKVTLRNREALAVVRPSEDALVLHTMLWPDEVRSPAAVFPPADIELRSQEVAMARSYIDTLTADFDPSRYHDEYRQALQEVITAKVEGHELEAAPSTPTQGNVVDLMAALRASVDEARRKRGEPAQAAAPDDDDNDKAAPAKKSTAKKPAAKTTTAKKAPAKKAPAEKTASSSASATAAKKPASTKSAAKKATKKAPVRTAKSA